MRQQSQHIHAIKAIDGVRKALSESLKNESKAKEIELLLFEESRRFVHDVIILLDNLGGPPSVRE